MTSPGSRFESDSAASVTGVAAGGLGTGANLDDTQVFRTEDLAAPAADTAEPIAADAGGQVAHEPAPAVAAAKPVLVPVALAPVAEPIAAPVPAAPVRPTVVSRRTSSDRQPGRGLAGLLAAALVVLAGVAFVVSRGDNTLGVGQGLPSAEAPATAQPDGAGGGGTGDGGGNGDGGEKGGGKDKDRGCNGNGNGRGNGCGGD